MTPLTFRHTRLACYLAAFSQAIVVNLAPLYFVIFREQFGLSFEQLGRLILLNFLTQLTADVITIRYADRLGYRRTCALAMGLNALGLVLLALLPGMVQNTYAALALATIVYSFGGGVCEVVTSPLLESLPGKEKEAAMSLMHSFYCWGQMTVIALTTLSLSLFGLGAWKAVAAVWALCPFLTMLLVTAVPIGDIVPEAEQLPMKRMLSAKGFGLAMLLMISAGASELTLSQWASYFVQRGLDVPKMTGDLLGPCLFAVLQGTGRVILGIFGSRIPLRAALSVCGCLSVTGYLLTALSPWPLLSLAGCALTGLGVSIMWPGTLSLMAAAYPRGGTRMFGILAVCGDIGCSTGPWLCGVVADATGGLRHGLLFATLFPLIMAAGVLCTARKTIAAR